MNAKDLKTDSALGGRINDGSTKYAQSGSTHQNSNKSYQDIGSNSMGKVDVQTSRPCAIIGPDRVLPSQNCNEGYLKKTPNDPWPCSDNIYRQSSDFTHKILEYQPTRNISPRQTFQENMQRIMVSPYSSMKKSDDSNFPVNRNVAMSKDVKLNIPLEPKYCDVPYTVNQPCNDQKSVRIADMRVSDVNPGVPRSSPHGWSHSNINVQPLRAYGAPELYQYSNYPSCAGPRPMPMVKPQRIVHDESGRMYPEPYYQDANVRFRPYPPTKGRYPHGRYEYITNYPNTFHPSTPFPPQAFDAQKSVPSHSYPLYPQAPLKYIDRRTGEPIMDGYQRCNPQANINVQYHNPIIHPPYGPLQSNCVQNNLFPYPSDNSSKALNKLPYTNNSKIYSDYEILQNKKIPISDTLYANDVNRLHPMKGDVPFPNYSHVNMHGIPQHTIYRRESIALKNVEYMPHLKNLDPVGFRNQLIRHPIHFSPNSIAISPSDSNTSNDTIQTQSTSQEDCGYVSQSSTTSGRSIDMRRYGISNEHLLYRSSDRYGFLPRNMPTQNPNSIKNSKVKRDLDVRQFLQMWNEGDDESGEQNKDENVAKDSNNMSSLPSQYENANTQEQLYVLGLVNVPSEELGKYDHIQKISKLPENIKGYNNIELLNQFEEVIESSNMKNIHFKTNKLMPKQTVKPTPRPVSPLDVEAKISQSVIHKEVGCNFEIKPCSPKMLNAEIATPVGNILEERIIEKISNPITPQAVLIHNVDNMNIGSSNFSNTSHCEKSLKEANATPSCNMDGLKYKNDNTLGIKENYTLQDLEYNSVCLASLPRLDNDIELNFPEINQQFINANKVESFTPLKELPNLDSGHLDRNIHNEKTGPITDKDSEKEFTKLSKYRKLKKTDLDQKDTSNQADVHDTLSKTQFRTDSVIIKNPENIKSHESNFITTDVHSTNNNSVKNTSLEDNIKKQNKTNIIANVVHEDGSSIAKIQSPYETMSDVESAIDFSLNRNDNELQKRSQKEGNTNESLINFIEENLNMSENSKFSTIAKNNDNSENVTSIEDISKNRIVLLSNGEQESEKINVENEVLQSNDDIVRNFNQDRSLPLHLELNCSTNRSEVISTVDEIDKSSVNSCEKPISDDSPEIVVDLKALISINTPEDENRKENYPACDTDDEKNIFNIQGTSGDLGKATNERCKMLTEEWHFNNLNKECTENLNLHCENIERSLESLIETSINNLEKERNVKVGYKEHEKEDTLIGLKKDNSNVTITRKTFHKRLCSPIVFNLMVYENPKESYVPQPPKSFSNTDMSKCNEQPIPLQDNSTQLESKMLLPGIVTKCTQQLEAIDTLTFEKSLVESEFNFENSEGLPKIDKPKLDNDESSSNIDNSTTNLTLIDIKKHDYSKNSNCCLENEMTDNEKSSYNNSYNDCTEIKNDSNTKCSASSVENKERIQSNETKFDELEKKQINLFSVKEVATIPENGKRNIRLKRSLSDSALNIYTNNEQQNVINDYSIPKKRKKINPCELMEPNLIAENLCNIIQTNRRNSISTLYDEDNVSFCILIDNSCDLIEESECSQKIRLAEISENGYVGELKDNCIITTDNVVFTDDSSDKIKCSLIEDLNTDPDVELQDAQPTGDNVFTTEYSVNERTEHKAFDEAWIEDVACIETVFSDEITEDIVLDPPSTPKYNHEVEGESEDRNESLIYNNINHMNKLKHIYGNEMCNDDADLVETLYRTPQMDVKKTLSRRESQNTNENNGYYDNDSLEKILSESNYKDEVTSDSESFKFKNNIACSDAIQSKNKKDDKENLDYELSSQNIFNYSNEYPISNCYDKAHKSLENASTYEPTQYAVVHSCESTCDYTSSYKNSCDSPRYSSSSSPEVSSTTSEEKSCGILLKITNCNGSISSQLNEFSPKNTNKFNSQSSKTNELINYNSKISRNRPLITKAAQKYIPPLKESMPDLKIKLPLPKHSLNKLKILKISKDKPKLDKPLSKNNNLPKPNFPKKIKPKFEDVLKSIDEIQIKMHKEKNKKQKHSIPKVVIKKNENGAHYASTSNDNDTYNPDLTGRKWQPWVFIEKNYFIDKMALNKKVKAVFNYRKNTYVLAEKFQKYKSIHNAKFVISQPKIEDISSGKLKYTIRLKHNY